MRLESERVQPCVECGGLMQWGRREDVLTYKGHSRRLLTEGYWCTVCGEGILEGPALLKREQEFLELKAEVDGVLGPSEVAAARKKIGLSQRKAGELLGGGPRAFQKYEAGRQAVSVAMSHLLRLLANEPARLAEISFEEKPPGKTTTKKATAGKRESPAKVRSKRSPSQLQASRKASPSAKPGKKPRKA